MTGSSLRDQGHQQVLEHSSEWWVSCCRRAVQALADSKVPFTVDHLRACGVPEPHHPNAWGAALRGAARADLIRPCGFLPAHRAESRGRVVRQWVGTGEAA